MNRISVIIPTYQHADTIAHCLDSVLAQSRRADEIIVVDDGSQDNTENVLNAYAERVSVIRQRNQGAPAARNNGFNAATGDYVLFCDADLIMHVDMLKHLERALGEHSEASYAYCRFKWGWKKFGSRTFDADALKERNYIHTSALIRREDFPGFAVDVKRFQDWDLWLTMLENGKTGVLLDEELFQIKIEDNRMGISSWLPSIMFKVPWDKMGWMPKRIRAYNEARAVILKRHAL